MSQRLTPKQEAFCVAYLETGNAAEAYRRAYDGKGGSPNSLYVTACRLLDNPKVALRIAVLQSVAAERAVVSKQRVLAELAAVAFGNLADVAPWDEQGPHIIPSKDLPPGKLAIVQSMKAKREREWRGRGEDAEPWEVEHIEVKLNDKLRALEMLGKHLGMFVERIELTDALKREAARFGLSEVELLASLDEILKGDGGGKG